MKKIVLLLSIACIFASTSYAQLSLTKMVGKNADKYRMGYDLFSFISFPLNNENQIIRLELMDLAYYAGKTGGSFFTTPNGAGYLSIKIGYKYVFSETKTGFYLEPALGYCRVVYSSEGEDPTHGDGIAGTVEGGYSLEVGQRGHITNPGLKYETDRATSSHIINSVGLCLSYEFNMFRKKEE